MDGDLLAVTRRTAKLLARALATPMPSPRRNDKLLPAGPALRELSPMLLTPGRPFASDEWIAEIKYDGIRLLAEVGPDSVTLKSRNGANATGWFPEIARSLAEVKRRGTFVVDGEIAVLDEYGRSDFNRTLSRTRSRGFPAGADPVIFCVFDLLVEAGKSVMGLTLLERKARLAKLLPLKERGLFAVSHFDGKDGLELYQHALSLKLEGVVYKRKDSPYLPGVRSASWIKAKRPGATPAKRFSREPV